MSWSGWLQSFSGSFSEKDSLDQNHNGNSSHNSSGNKCHSLTKIYPEEGISEEDASVNLVSSPREVSYSIPLQSSHHNFINARTQSVISSTHLYSPSTGNLIVNDILGEPLLSQPSTSADYFQNTSPIQEDSLTLLKKSFPEGDPEPFYQPSTSVITFPTTRKRLREATNEGSKSSDTVARLAQSRHVMTSSPNTLPEVSDGTEDSHERHKRPRFSVSAFGSPIYNKKAEKSEPSFSLFYPGKIMFGGAANHQTRRNRMIPKKITPRPRVTNNPSASTNDQSLDGGLSLAAKRILECIDKISTPLSNSKRIHNSRDLLFGSSPFEADFHKHRPVLKTKMQTSTPPASKLLTPSRVMTHKNLSGFIGQKRSASILDSSTNNSKQSSVTLDSQTLPASRTLAPPTTTSRDNQVVLKSSLALSTAPTTFSLTNIPKTSFVTSTKPDTSNRLIADWGPKTCKKSVPKIELKNYSKSSLFTSKVTDNTSSIVIVEPVKTNESYTFSVPTTLSTVPVFKEVPASLLVFKFSEPIDIEKSTGLPKIPEVSNSNWANKFKPPEGSWECSVCLIQNKDSEKCIACETHKIQKKELPLAKTTTPSLISTFGDKFKAPEGVWDCDVCMLQNKDGAVECVACLTPKPSAKEIKPDNIKSSAKQSSLPVTNNWGSQFALAQDSWECQVCLLQNKGSVSKCAACETSKSQPNSIASNKSVSSFLTGSNQLNNSAGWGDSFKPAKGSWDCPGCLLQNDAKFSNCVACQSAKPKETSPTGKSIQSEMEIAKENLTPKFDKNVNETSNKNLPFAKLNNTPFITKDNNSNFSFGIPTTIKNMTNETKSGKEWECETCLVRNKATSKKCVCCDAPRQSSNRSSIVSEALTGNFKFGVPKPELKFTSSLPAFSSPVIVTQPVNTPKTDTKIPLSSSFSWSRPVAVTTVTTSSVASSSVKNSAVLSFTSPIQTLVSEGPKINNIPLTFPTIPESFKPALNNTLSETKLIPLPAAAKNVSKPVFQFSSAPVSSIPSSISSQKLEFPKFDKISVPGSTKQPEPFKADLAPKINPSTFSFFGKESKAPSFPSFSSKSANATSVTQSKINPLMAPTPSTKPSFSFGQANSTPLNTGFSFGQTENKAPSAFSFGNTGSSPSFFQFGQQSTPAQTPQMTAAVPAPPAFMSMKAPQTNMFSVAAGAAVGPQKRIFKKALRRTNKP